MKCKCCKKDVCLDAAATCNSCQMFICKKCLEIHRTPPRFAAEYALCVRCAIVICVDKNLDSISFNAQECCVTRTLDSATRMMKTAEARTKALNYGLKTNSAAEDSQSSAEVDVQQAVSTAVEQQTVVKMKVTTLNKPTIASGANVSIGGIKTTVFASQ